MHFIRIKQAAGVSVQTIYRWANTDPEFPTLVKLGPNSTVIEKDLFDSFIQKRIDDSKVAQAERIARHAGVPA